MDLKQCSGSEIHELSYERLFRLNGSTIYLRSLGGRNRLILVFLDISPFAEGKIPGWAEPLVYTQQMWDSEDQNLFHGF